LWNEFRPWQCFLVVLPPFTLCERLICLALCIYLVIFHRYFCYRRPPPRVFFLVSLVAVSLSLAWSQQTAILSFFLPARHPSSPSRTLKPSFSSVSATSFTARGDYASFLLSRCPPFYLWGSLMVKSFQLLPLFTFLFPVVQHTDAICLPFSGETLTITPLEP